MFPPISYSAEHVVIGVEVNKDLVMQENELLEKTKSAYENDMSQPDPEWKNPVWRHGDGSIAEW